VELLCVIANGYSGILLAFLININDQHQMKSIDKLHHKYPAGLCQDKWSELNVGNNAVKVFELYISCEFEVHQKPEAKYAF